LSANWLAIEGLGLDILGAWYLAQGIMRNPDHRIASVSGAFLDSNPFLTASLIEQKLDATAGFILLAFGFGFQMAASLGISQNIDGYGLWELLPFGAGLLVFDSRRERAIVERTVLAITNEPGEWPELRDRLRRYLRNERWSSALTTGRLNEGTL
jgi:hypothetical protein